MDLSERDFPKEFIRKKHLLITKEKENVNIIYIGTLYNCPIENKSNINFVHVVEDQILPRLVLIWAHGFKEDYNVNVIRCQ